MMIMQATAGSRRRIATLLVGASVIGGLSMAGWFWGALSRGASITDDGRLEISPARGIATFEDGESQLLSFHVVNRTASQITIDRVRSSCGCTVVRKSGNAIAPRSGLEIIVEVQVPPNGTRHSRITIDTGHGNYEIPITLEGAPLQVPVVLDFPRSWEVREYGQRDEPVSREFVVRTAERTDSSPWIHDVVSSNPEVKVQVSQPVNQETLGEVTTRAYKVRVESLIPKGDEQDKSSQLSLLVGEERSNSGSRQRCVVTVKSIPSVRLHPSELLFRIKSGDNHQEKIVNVISEVPVTGDLALTEDPEDWMSVDFAPGKLERVRTVRVRVSELPRLPECGFRRSEVVLTTGVPSMPTVVLPVMVSE